MHILLDGGIFALLEIKQRAGQYPMETGIRFVVLHLEMNMYIVNILC